MNWKIHKWNIAIPNAKFQSVSDRNPFLWGSKNAKNSYKRVFVKSNPFSAFVLSIHFSKTSNVIFPLLSLMAEWHCLKQIKLNSRKQKLEKQIDLILLSNPSFVVENSLDKARPNCCCTEDFQSKVKIACSFSAESLSPIYYFSSDYFNIAKRLLEFNRVEGLVAKTFRIFLYY